jgi:hypothetical protein
MTQLLDVQPGRSALDPVRPARVLHVRIDLLLLEIAPDPVVATAIVSPAGHGPLIVGRAAAAPPVDMRAITVLASGDHVWRTEIPAERALIQVLARERE